MCPLISGTKHQGCLLLRDIWTHSFHIKQSFEGYPDRILFDSKWPEHFFITMYDEVLKWHLWWLTDRASQTEKTTVTVVEIKTLSHYDMSFPFSCPCGLMIHILVESLPSLDSSPSSAPALLVWEFRRFILSFLSFGLFFSPSLLGEFASTWMINQG